MTQITINRTSTSLERDQALEHRRKSDLVNAERDRRVLAGLTVELPDSGPSVRLIGDTQTTANTGQLGMAAFIRISANDDTLFEYRDADDVVHDLTPSQMLAIWQAGVQFVSAVYEASWAIKDAPGGIDEAAIYDDVNWP